jgi:hypothetical protein
MGEFVLPQVGPNFGADALMPEAQLHGERLPWAHENRLQQLHRFLLTTNGFNRGICFSLKDNSNGLKTLDSGTASSIIIRLAAVTLI